MDEEPKSDRAVSSSSAAREDGWNVTLNQMWELFFGPEIARRKNSGIIDNEFNLYMGQVLFPESGGNVIRLNAEVTGQAVISSSRKLSDGEAVVLADLEQLEVYDLPEDLLDCGHFTIFRRSEGWTMCFNFLSGRAKALDMLGVARQFVQTAKSSRDLGYAGPAVENLFTATELVCKANLILHRHPSVKSKTHSTIASAINAWSRIGNIDAAFVGLFNKLSQQRPNARYGDPSSRPPMPDQENFELVSAMIEKGETRVKNSVDRDRKR